MPRYEAPRYRASDGLVQVNQSIAAMIAPAAYLRQRDGDPSRTLLALA